MHAPVRYHVVNPSSPATHMVITIHCASINGFDGGNISPVWPQPGTDLKQYAREAVLRKLRASLSPAYTDESLTDSTPWPVLEATGRTPVLPRPGVAKPSQSQTGTSAVPPITPMTPVVEFHPEPPVIEDPTESTL